MTTQIAYSIIEEQEGKIKRDEINYVSFVGLLADPRYCGKSIYCCFSFDQYINLSENNPLIK
jgi:hypothetical protein